MTISMSEWHLFRMKEFEFKLNAGKATVLHS